MPDFFHDSRDEFDTDDEGRIISYPLTSCLVASVDSMALFCQLEFVLSKEQLNDGSSERLQLLMTSEQAQDLAALLLRQIDKMAAGISLMPVM